ncbi:MAG TPA: SDR family oxidoreductase [Thermoanaerobaculia bacterium]|nr:SDR family oxidoreductase [Thermoanaerobaculia bacterium]
MSTPSDEAIRHTLAGRAALVTGGGSGIGLGIATALAEAGCAVALAGRREDPLRRAADELAERGVRTATSPGDVTDPVSAGAMVERAVAELGSLHVVVNAAGVAQVGPFAEIEDDDVHGLIDVDLKGPIFVTRAALPALRAHRESGGAAVLNVSSSVTLMALKEYAVYSSAKAGVDMLTRCLALELAADRIRVNAVLPGVVETGIFAKFLGEERARRHLEAMPSFVPLGRIGQPADVGRAALFLCDPANDWITGAILPVDGGLSLGPG